MKITVLMSTFNGERFLREQIDSILGQTADAFIYARDDGSTDDSLNFLQQRYAAEISSGKIKLKRNGKNLGEMATVNKLIHEATGKYFMILHSDDLYLPQAVEQMYFIAEHFKAEVVNGCRFFNSPKDGIITQGTPLQILCPCRAPVNEPTVIPADKISRFMEWATDSTFLDSQYSIYNRQFMLDNGLFLEKSGGLHLLLLRWLLNAKIFVKVPLIPYVRRDAPDSFSNNLSKFSIEKFIAEKIDIARRLEEILPELKMFDDNAEIKRFILLKFLIRSHQIQISGRGIYGNGITPELRVVVENTFQKHLGDASAYAAFLFHLIFMIPTNENFEQIMLNDGLKKVLSTFPNKKT